MDNNNKKPGADKQPQQGGQKPQQGGEKSGKGDHQQGNQSKGGQKSDHQK